MLSVREIENQDIDGIINYWLSADPFFLKGMGVDVDKIPAREEWKSLLEEQLSLPVEKRQSYCIIWLYNNKAVGHSNVNKIVFGEEAYMHLHLWSEDVRKKGFGTKFVKMTLPYFFEKLKLKKLCSEPYSGNSSPNKTLEKAGFVFIKKDIKVPGWINFEQEINLWELGFAAYASL